MNMKHQKLTRVKQAPFSARAKATNCYFNGGIFDLLSHLVRWNYNLLISDILSLYINSYVNELT